MDFENIKSAAKNIAMQYLESLKKKAIIIGASIGAALLIIVTLASGESANASASSESSGSSSSSGSSGTGNSSGMTSASTGGTSTSGAWGNINVYNSDGTVNEEKIADLQEAFEKEFNLVKGSPSGFNIGGRYNFETCKVVTGKYLGWDGYAEGYDTDYNDTDRQYKAHNLLGIYQCTWWANGRASEHLSRHGTKYKEYPSAEGDGGEVFNVNKANGWFKYGSEPKQNSLVSYKGGKYGHVAYVEAVDIKNKCYYISHAGSGLSWFGIQKYKIGEAPYSYSTVGFVYLDEPIT